MPLSTRFVLNDRYRIVKLLGKGGMGAVYRAWDWFVRNYYASSPFKNPKDPPAQVLTVAAVEAVRHSCLPERSAWLSIIAGSHMRPDRLSVSGALIQTPLVTRRQPNDPT